MPQVASLDLRPLAVTRSEEQKSAGPLEVPHGRVNATILLPVGSSPGVYEVRILDRDLRVRASTTGSAEIRNYITTLLGHAGYGRPGRGRLPAHVATRGRRVADIPDAGPLRAEDLTVRPHRRRTFRRTARLEACGSIPMAHAPGATVGL